MQLNLCILLKWSFAFLRSSQLFIHWLWYNFTSSFEMFLISPQQAYSFVVDFLNNSIQSFFLSSFHSILSILSETLRWSSRQVSVLLILVVPLFFSSALDSLLLLLSSYFTSSLFSFRLSPKISGRDLLLVEESCNAPSPMLQMPFFILVVVMCSFCLLHYHNYFAYVIPLC